MPPKSSGPKKLTKAQYITELAAKTGLTKKQVEAVFDAQVAILRKELSRTGELTIIPGMIKVRKVHKPATPARAGRNPATGEPMTIKAKPARKDVKLSKLKALKEL